MCHPTHHVAFLALAKTTADPNTILSTVISWASSHTSPPPDLATLQRAVSLLTKSPANSWTLFPACLFALVPFAASPAPTWKTLEEERPLQTLAQPCPVPLQQMVAVPLSNLGVQPNHTLQWTFAHLKVARYSADKLNVGAAPSGDEGLVRSL